MNDARPRLAMVVQRYGREVTGGSESLCRAVAERLAADPRVTVFTTCARDYVTWRNELARGRRASSTGPGRCVSRSRRSATSTAFNASPSRSTRGPRPTTRRAEFLRRQGPYVPAPRGGPGRAEGRVRRDLLLHLPLLPDVLRPAGRAAERAILVPTTHDEPPLRFSVYREVFARPRAFAFLTPPEEALVRARFDLGAGPRWSRASGWRSRRAPDVEGFRIRHGVHRPYALYAGRIDAGKGCDGDARVLRPLSADAPGRRGPAAHRDPRHARRPRARGALPRLPRRRSEKHRGHGGGQGASSARAPTRACPSCCSRASPWARPASSMPARAVLEDHCRRSNAGLLYADADEFAEALDLLAAQDGLRAALGAQRPRVRRCEHYGWATVLARYESLIEAVAS